MNCSLSFNQSSHTTLPINQSDILPRFAAELQLQNISHTTNAVGVVVFRWNPLVKRQMAEADYNLAQKKLIRALRDFKQAQDIFFTPRRQSLGLILFRQAQPILHLEIRNLLHQIARGKIQPTNGPVKMIRQALDLKSGWATGKPAVQGANILRLAEKQTYSTNSLI